MPRKKGLFDTGLLMRAGQRGAGIAAGTIGGELVEEKLPIQNNKIKGLMLFTLGAYVSEYYNDNPIIGGLGAGVCAAGTRTALKDNLQFLAGPGETATIPEDFEIDDEDFDLVEGVVDEIDDEVVEGVTEEIDNEVVEGATEEIDDEVLEGSDDDDEVIILDDDDEDF